MKCVIKTGGGGGGGEEWEWMWNQVAALREEERSVSASPLVTRLSFHLRGLHGSGCIAPPYQKRTNHPREKERGGGGGEGKSSGSEGTDRQIDRKERGKEAGSLCFFVLVSHFVCIFSPSRQE